MGGTRLVPCAAWRLQPASDGEVDRALAPPEASVGAQAPARRATARLALEAVPPQPDPAALRSHQTPEWMGVHLQALAFLAKASGAAAVLVGAAWVAQFAWAQHRAKQRDTEAGLQATGSAAADAAAVAASVAAPTAAVTDRAPRQALFRTVPRPHEAAAAGAGAAVGAATSLLPPQAAAAGPASAPAATQLPQGWWRALDRLHYISFGSQYGVLPRLRLDPSVLQEVGSGCHHAPPLCPAFSLSSPLRCSMYRPPCSPASCQGAAARPGGGQPPAPTCWLARCSPSPPPPGARSFTAACCRAGGGGV